jgi:hypothetical protein
MEPTITLAEANRVVDEYIQRALAELPQEADLDERARSEAFPCEDPTDRGPQGRKIADRDFRVVGLEKDVDKISEYFEALRSWWQANNFKFLRDDTTGKHKTLDAINRDDSFTMTFVANENGSLFLMASSPCVWPEGTPDPE